MLIGLLVGLGLGFIMALPPGPVAVSAIKLGLNQGRKQGAMLALGNGIMDSLYCMVAVFAASALIGTLNSFSAEHPVIMLFIQLGIVAGLIIYGIVNVRTKTHVPSMEVTPKKGFAHYFDKLAHKGPIFLGIAVAMTNIPNPTFFPSLVAFTGTILNFNLFESNSISNIMFALGFGLGNTLWLYLLVRLIVHYKSKFSPATLVKIQRFAGVTLIGFGTILGYRILTITEWSRIIRLVFAF